MADLVTTSRFFDLVLERANARLASDRRWTVKAVYPNGLDMQRTIFGRVQTISVRAQSDGWS